MITVDQFVPTDLYAFASKILDCITGYISLCVAPRSTDISAVIGTIVGQRLDIVSLQSSDDFSGYCLM
jgi:hypothetical protein